MAKAKNKKVVEQEIETVEEPIFPLTADGVKFLVQLIDFAASKGAFPIDQYPNVHTTYATAINYLMENGHIETEEADSE